MINAWSLLYDELYGDDEMTDKTYPVENNELNDENIVINTGTGNTIFNVPDNVPDHDGGINTTEGVTYRRLEDLKNYPKLNAMSGYNSVIGKIREPKNSNYMSYYDDDLIQLILNRDGDYIKRFNYLDKLEDKMYD